MKKIKNNFLVSALVLVGAMSFVPAVPVFAEDAVGPKKCGDIETSVAGVLCNNDGGNPIMSIVMQVANFLAIGVGIAVVGGIVWGSLLYTTSNGEPAKTQQGITVIVNAVIGLLLFIFAYAIIDFLTPGNGIL